VERCGLIVPCWKNSNTFVARKQREADMIAMIVTVAMREVTTDMTTTVTKVTATRWTGLVVIATATTGAAEEEEEEGQVEVTHLPEVQVTMEKSDIEMHTTKGAEEVYPVGVVGHLDITWEVLEEVGVAEELRIMETGACKFLKISCPPNPWKVLTKSTMLS